MTLNANPQSPAQEVGPNYKPAEQKPTATVSNPISYENVHILPQTPQLIALLTCVSPSSHTLSSVLYAFCLYLPNQFPLCCF